MIGGTGNPGKLGLARFNLDGSLDNSFGSSGATIFDVQPGSDHAYAVGQQTSGKIVVAGISGSFGSTPASAVVARFTAVGAIDSGRSGFGDIVKGKARGYTLNTFGPFGSGIADVAVQPDNKLLGVGSFTATGNGDARLFVCDTPPPAV